MKNFKYILLASLFALCAFSITTYTSCNSDKCKNVDCRNGGSCADGKCTCPTGFKGDMCEALAEFCDMNQCLNGGTCTGNACSCTTGYEGVTCEVESRTKFINGYVCLDVVTGNMVSFQYNTQIIAGDQLTQVKITNFSNGQFTQPVVANVVGNSLLAPLQYPDNNGRSIQATGLLSSDGNSIEWVYQIATTSGDTTNYQGVWGH